MDIKNLLMLAYAAESDKELHNDVDIDLTAAAPETEDRDSDTDFQPVKSAQITITSDLNSSVYNNCIDNLSEINTQISLTVDHLDKLYRKFVEEETMMKLIVHSSTKPGEYIYLNSFKIDQLGLTCHLLHSDVFTSKYRQNLFKSFSIPLVKQYNEGIKEGKRRKLSEIQ